MTSEVNGVAAAQLRSIVDRILRLQEERKAIADDIADVYGEAKANGYDTKALKVVVRLSAQDASVRLEHEAMVELYKNALNLV